MSLPQDPEIAQAIDQAARRLEMERRRAHINSPQHCNNLIRALTGLAALRLQVEDYSRADRLYREAEMHADEEWRHVTTDIRIKLKSQRGYLSECMDNTEQAIACYEHGLKIADDHDITLSETRAVIHNNLAILFKKAEKWDQSEHHYKMALVILEALAGSNSEKVASIYNNIGTFYSRLDKLKAAEKMFRRALRIREQSFNDDTHEDVQQSLKNLGATLKAIGNDEEANACFERVPGIDVPQFLARVIDGDQERMESFAEVA